MKAFCIFNDFPEDCISQLNTCGIELTKVQKGYSRPSDSEMKHIMEKYDVIIIGTSQKIYDWMWENIESPRLIGTASVGIDHISVPSDKKHLLRILNTPTANAQSVAEYTIGAMLLTRKRFAEGAKLYSEGKDNKNLVCKPEDIHEATIGIVGAGNISSKLMELLQPFGVNIICYTKNPQNHKELEDRYAVTFVDLASLSASSDIISVNVPYDASTENLINADLINRMKEDCTFISVSREQVTDNRSLLKKANLNPNFYVVLDLDVIPSYIKDANGRNIIITPHIAGGTIETRKRMFKEVTERICKSI